MAVSRAHSELSILTALCGAWRAARVSAAVSVASTVRIAIIPVIAGTVVTHSSWAGPTLVLFILLDVLDGVIARHQGVEDAGRRYADSLVDHGAIHVAFVAAMLGSTAHPSVVVLLLLRDLYCLGVCRPLGRRYVAIRADWLYKTLNITLAAWIVAAPWLSFTTRHVAIFPIAALAVYVTVDLRHLVSATIRLDLPRAAVVEAGVVRRLRKKT